VDKSEIEVQGETYVVMRERDVHAIAADRLDDDGESTGLYL
jgi:chaperonin GroES